MGRYLFEQDRIHYWTEQGQGVMPLDVFRSSEMPVDRQADILLAVDPGPATFALVRAIKEIFARGRIRTLVPYARALQAFLMERKLMEDGQMCLVLDDVGERFLLTVMSTAKVFVTRALADARIDKVTEEIRRTQKNIGARGEDMSWRVLSNHEGLVQTLEGAIFFETCLPAMQVLGRVKFPGEAMTPEDVAAAQRQKQRMGWVMSMLLGLAFAGAGAGYYAHKCGEDRQMEQHVHILESKRDVARERVERLAKQRYQDRLREVPAMDLGVNMDDLYRSLFYGMRLISVTFERGDEMRLGSWRAMLRVDGEHRPWDGKGIWEGARGMPWLEHGRAGLRITGGGT